MKRYHNICLTLVALLLALNANAQETYEDANLFTPELNGTARYVGMGGAMDALGADISTISSNPAGIALFRSNSVSVSGGLVSQSAGGDTKASFDQIGLVLANKLAGGTSMVNYGFNYHKSRNFNQVLSAAGRLNSASLNKQTYLKGIAGALFDDQGREYITSSRLDEIIANKVLWEEAAGGYYYKDATGYIFDRTHSGYIGDYDFNISANLKDRWYLGLTLGIHDVHYKGETSYVEQLEPNALGMNEMDMNDYRKISGTGVDFKLGVIYRPVVDSPFRIGLSISTPTFYDLKSESVTRIGANKISSYYDFKLNTPWKFALSLGHTVGKNLAFGVVYEYADFAHINNRVNDGYYYDWYGGGYETSSADRKMNRHTKESLKGVSTLKLGLEYRPIPALALRAGYNYQSALYDKQAAKGIYKNYNLVESYGIYASSTADYTNWDSTNRFTLGAGYTAGRFTFDLAYQYQQTSGKFRPFLSLDYTDENNNVYTNYVDATDVDFKRHQVLGTITYKF